MRTIPSDIVSILTRGATVEGNSVVLRCGQLAPKTYRAVNEVLETLGGKWNRKSQAHLFPYDPTEDLRAVVECGELPEKNPLQFYATPPALADKMVDMIEARYRLRRRLHVLEPSAGDGALVEAFIRSVLQPRFPHQPDTYILTAVEMDPRRVATLRARGISAVEQDFLTYHARAAADVVIMNPPFRAAGDPLADQTHVRHAYEQLAPGGLLLAIMSPGFTFRADRRSTAFREWVEDGCGRVERNPAGTFRGSGTDVETVILRMQKH